MKIKIFNKSSLAKRSSPKNPIIRVSKKGHIVLNEAAVTTTSMTEDRKLQFVQDEDKPKDWFVNLTDEDHGLDLKVNKAQSGFKVQNSELARIIIDSVDPNESSIAMLLAKEPVEINGLTLWPIITSSYKNFIKK